MKKVLIEYEGESLFVNGVHFNKYTELDEIRDGFINLLKELNIEYEYKNN